jgi:hypothetical protein
MYVCYLLPLALVASIIAELHYVGSALNCLTAPGTTF